ncbi:MAG: hypothetical protein D6785_16180 [Planctomycetota bacterium]|nr:MAG: hypothetical protein D6785_16180 [Planctomycetota bacterium]
MQRKNFSFFSFRNHLFPLENTKFFFKIFKKDVRISGNLLGIKVFGSFKRYIIKVIFLDFLDFSFLNENYLLPLFCLKS